MKEPDDKKATSWIRIIVALLLAIAVTWVCLYLWLRPRVWQQPTAVDFLDADPKRLRSHVERLATTFENRNSDHPEILIQAAEFIEHQFRQSGASVQLQRYPEAPDRPQHHLFRNVIARFGPQTGPRWVIGAHYDSFGLFGTNPGADDNASGVAGLLELARILGRHLPPQRIELVAFSTEEPPQFASPIMGSYVYAESPAAENANVEIMVNLEMIGYFTERQPWPNWLYRSLFPGRGDFITVLGRKQEAPWVKYFAGAYKRRAAIPVVAVTIPNGLPGADGSDHRSFWSFGYDAIMITDTAFLRNPSYHTPEDTADTLDYDQMARVVNGVALAILAHNQGTG